VNFSKEAIFQTKTLKGKKSWPKLFSSRENSGLREKFQFYFSLMYV